MCLCHQWRHHYHYHRHYQRHQHRAHVSLTDNPRIAPASNVLPAPHSPSFRPPKGARKSSGVCGANKKEYPRSAVQVGYRPRGVRGVGRTCKGKGDRCYPGVLTPENAGVFDSSVALHAFGFDPGHVTTLIPVRYVDDMSSRRKPTRLRFWLMMRSRTLEGPHYFRSVILMAGLRSIVNERSIQVP